MSKGQEVSRLLTATKSGKLWVGGALELLECRVLRERLGDVFRAVHAELVVREAVSEGANAVSAAADSVGIRVWGAYLRICSVELVFNASITWAAPSAFRLL